MERSATAAARAEPAPTWTAYGHGHELHALAAFLRRHPEFDASRLDQLRAREYGRLDAQGQVYLAYTGGGLYAESQLFEHLEFLQNAVLGNPHSISPTSAAATELMEVARTAG